MTKIIIKGEAGQGIKLIGNILADILKEEGYHVVLTNKYSPLVRSGESVAYIIFSKEKIDNPIIEDADFKFDINELKEELLKKGNKNSINFVLLGIILNKLNINFKYIEKHLPKKFLEDNLKAISNGYS